MDRFGLGLLLEIKQQSQATKWYADWHRHSNTKR